MVRTFNFLTGRGLVACLLLLTAPAALSAGEPARTVTQVNHTQGTWCDSCQQWHGGHAHGGHWHGGGHWHVGRSSYSFGTRHGIAVVNQPLVRTAKTYHNYYPAAWTGTAVVGPVPRYPIAYQPTDTTQLGFYGVHVPRWTAQPEMLPPAPQPNWYIGGASWGGNGGWDSGYTYSADTTAETYNGTLTPIPQQTPVPAATAPAYAPPPAPAAPVPEPEAYLSPPVRR